MIGMPRLPTIMRFAKKYSRRLIAVNRFLGIGNFLRQYQLIVVWFLTSR